MTENTDIRYKCDKNMICVSFRTEAAVAVCIFIIMFSVFFSTKVYASSQYVSVTIPDFPVYFNDVKVENSTREYPVLVYRDMAYFPMTYYDARFMGIETKWDPDSGFVITKAGVPQAYCDYTGASDNQNLTAYIITGNISVNGNNIDNSKEVYPVLSFRNVPYFPMTQRFCEEEFDWNFSFTAEKGLEVSEKSGTYQAETAVSSTLILPNMKKNDGSGVAFAMADGYFYYEGAKGEIYLASVSDPSSAEVIFQLPEITSDSSGTDDDQSKNDKAYPKLVLKSVKKKVLLSYVETQNGKSRTRCYVLKQDDIRKTFRIFKTEKTRKVKSNGHVYYIDDTGQLRKKGDDEIINPGGIVDRLEVQEGYVLATFSDRSENEYRTFVIGKTGDIIYRSTEETANVVICDGKLMFIKEQF